MDAATDVQARYGSIAAGLVEDHDVAVDMIADVRNGGSRRRQGSHRRTLEGAAIEDSRAKY
jgi:hypothetical protein